MVRIRVAIDIDAEEYETEGEICESVRAAFGNIIAWRARRFRMNFFYSPFTFTQKQTTQSFGWFLQRR